MAYVNKYRIELIALIIPLPIYLMLLKLLLLLNKLLLFLLSKYFLVLFKMLKLTII